MTLFSSFFFFRQEMYDVKCAAVIEKSVAHIGETGSTMQKKRYVLTANAERKVPFLLCCAHITLGGALLLLGL